MAKIKLLFIEDDKESIKPIIKQLDEYHFDITSFADSEDKIDSFSPQMIVLDIFEGPISEQKKTGEEKFYWIWEKRFCPIIVYSADPSVLDVPPHPFLKSVQKGAGSPDKIKAALNELKPQSEAIYEAERHVKQQFAFALRDVAPYAFETFPTASDYSKRNNLIKRVGRRRLAALMDEPSIGPLASWEQYLCPPVSKNFQLGDIIHEKGHSNDEPTSFRIVLTPSCDLVKSNLKVKKVLVARCMAIKDGINHTSLKDIGTNKLKERLPSLLTQGYFETIMPFPPLKDRIPLMAASFRDLELISLNQIERDYYISQISVPFTIFDSISLIPISGRFERIASIDSPFRELVTWVYMHVACRPGFPDRDLKPFCDEITSEYQKQCQ